jgi:hypothetical protein
MSKSLIIVLVALFAGISISTGVAYYALVGTSEPVTPPATERTTSEPRRDTDDVTNSAPRPQGTPPKQPTLSVNETQIDIATFAGTPRGARDPLATSDTVQLLERTGETYYALGALPRDILGIDIGTTTVTQTSDARGYDLFYYPNSGSFAVTLFKEPLGDVRRAALLDLETRLGLTVPRLCTVLVDVRVETSGFLAGKHIGFPGCPGATALPGD